MKSKSSHIKASNVDETANRWHIISQSLDLKSHNHDKVSHSGCFVSHISDRSANRLYETLNTVDVIFHIPDEKSKLGSLKSHKPQTHKKGGTML